MPFLIERVLFLYYNVLQKGGTHMIVSIRMSNEEKQLADAYAKLTGVSLSEAIKKAYFEKIEEQYDIALADAALKEYEKDPAAYTLDDVKKMFNL